jgi:hypothetical protein
MIKLGELLFGKPDCDCGCDDCNGTKLNEGVKVSENLQYHLDNQTKYSYLKQMSITCIQMQVVKECMKVN